MKDKKGKIGFFHAVNGIIAVTKSEWNFRFHLLLMILVIGVGIFFRLSSMEWIAVVIVIGMVLITEMLNTTVEKIIDYLKPEFHPAARFIKDAAAGAVLISAITAVIVGIIIFLPKFIMLFE